MNQERRENFYILLDLSISPPENDLKQITAAINKKQAEWSKMRNHPTKARQVQLYLDMLPEIKAVMMDDAKRKQEAKEAKQIIGEREKAKFKELDEAIKLLSTKNYITKDEVKKLSQRFSVSEDELRGRIKVIIKEGDNGPTTKVLDISLQEKIRAALAIVRKGSLYDFLELSTTSTLKTLIEKTKERDRELKKDAHKNARLTASLELTGHCLNMYKTEENRKMYDDSLAKQRLVDLDKAIDIAGMDGIIQVVEFDALVKKAKELGLQLEDAKKYIKDYCQQRKWPVEIPTIFSIVDMKQCGVCGLMNKPDAKNCTKCGYPLDVQCPQCSQPNPSTNTNCSNCGFPIGDMPNALRLIKEADRAKAEGDLKKTAHLLQQALKFWPNYPEAQSRLQGLETEIKTIESLVRQLNEQLDNKQCYKAREVLYRLKQLAPLHPRLSLETVINNKITTAENWVKKAKAAKGDDAVYCYSQALLECNDCREASDGVNSYPPAPPGNLMVTPSSTYISLRWSKTSSRGNITYRIIRKENSHPLNVQDGKSLGETLQLFFNDADSEPGVLYYYGIYAKREQIFSQHGAAAGPVMRTGEVRNLVATPGNSMITLNWEAPPRAETVEVRYRQGSPPSGINDGCPLQGVRKDGVVAQGLKNGQSHGFTIFTIFKDEKGNRVYSNGLTCQSMPVEPPPPVTDLKISRQGNRLDISWTPVQRGTVQIFSSPRPFTFSIGQNTAVSQLSGIGTQIPVQRQGYTQMSVNFQGAFYILPVTIVGDVAVPGKVGIATSIDDVANLDASISSGKLYLEWEWPRDVDTVLVMYNHVDFPNREDSSNSVSKTFTRSQYSIHSAFVIRSPEPRDYYFAVYAAVSLGDDVLYSTGTRCFIANSPVKEVYYDIHLQRGFSGKVNSAKIRLYTESESFGLPDAILIMKNGGLPLGKTDGTTLLEIKSRNIGPVPVSFDIPVRRIQQGGYAKLFLKNDPDNRRFRLMPPARTKLRIG
jgi:hypothetical protein